LPLVSGQRGENESGGENRFRIFHQSDRALYSANFLAIGAKINEALLIGGVGKSYKTIGGVIVDKPNEFTPQPLERFERELHQRVTSSFSICAVMPLKSVATPDLQYKVNLGS
jgi:hypothetical protein